MTIKVYRTIVQIIQEVQISQGQIIQATLYLLIEES